MQSVFGMHNPKRVKAFCYATTASDRSIHRQQIEREAPVFRDVSTWSPDRLVEQIVQDKIHILVNLNGYTRGARNEIFAARPAPIQMSFMGFAGTLGAEWCDYLLADTTAIPPSTLRPHRNNVTLEDVFRDEADAEAEDWVYSENIIFCRDTFFCCDHAQSADGYNERDLTWEDDQRRRWKMRKELFPSLPDDAILLGNFNQLYKVRRIRRSRAETGTLTSPFPDRPHHLPLVATHPRGRAQGLPLAAPLPRARRDAPPPHRARVGWRGRRVTHHLHRRRAQAAAHRPRPRLRPVPRHPGVQRPHHRRRHPLVQHPAADPAAVRLQDVLAHGGVNPQGGAAQGAGGAAGG